MKLYIFILLSIVVIFLLLKTSTRYFEGFDNNLNYYVIHLSSNKERKENIKKQEEIIGEKIKYFEAIVGKDYVGKLDFVDTNIIDHWHHSPGELGCYLSHLMLLKQISESNEGYSVIFEDDFKVEDPNLNQYILDCIKNLNDDNRDFDFIFLGRCCDNNGSEYKGKLREIKKLDDDILIMCTHAYVIKNKNADKIYKSLLDMDDVLDHKFNKLLKKAELKGYLIDPSIVNQQNTVLPSTIGH